ncbi:MAG TPA: carbamoyltransferase HypF, partial [bacterium]|nr:carbamoyltransferase HypF [bacterium]
MKGAARIEVSGVVQGVGFRPFIHRLAEVYNLKGWVLNSGKGVIIDVEGERENIRNFYQKIFTQAPPLARIEKKRIKPHPPNGYKSFKVKESLIQEEKSTLVSPDISICFHCLDELFDAKDRRYRYPFINCTNCGPRFSIIRDLPYDREKTTMDRFPMCSSCQEEYLNISQRRYHTQPTACPDCGPGVELVRSSPPPTLSGEFASRPEGSRDPRGRVRSIFKSEEAIKETIRLLKEGKIIAIKGLGGFHLACDATSEEAVRALRRRKKRPNKPLAIMSFDVEKIRNYCQVREKERELLKSPQRPIVLLKKRKGSFPIAESIAPGNGYLGVMLPYTPLHYLLLENSFLALVMTSGNLSGEPLITDNQEALNRLSGIADHSLSNLMVSFIASSLLKILRTLPRGSRDPSGREANSPDKVGG